MTCSAVATHGGQRTPAESGQGNAPGHTSAAFAKIEAVDHKTQT